MIAPSAPRARPADIRPVAPPAGGFKPRDLLLRLLRHAPLIVCTLVIGATLGYFVVRSLPLRYTSSVEILIDPKRPGTVGADATFANLYVDNTKISSVELIMTSSSLLGRVVQAEHLADMPEFGDDRPSFTHKYLAFLAGPPPAAEPDTLEEREERALGRLARAVKTQRLGMTYVIRVDVSASSSALAFRLTKAVAAAYMQDQLDTKYEAARRDSEWLSKRLDQLRGELIRSEDNVEVIRQKSGLTQTDHGPGSTVDRQSITDINGQLAQADGEVTSRQARYEQAERLKRSGGDLQGLPEVAASKVIEGLRQQQATANRVVADMAAHYTASFPGLKSAEADRRTIDGQIATEVSRVVDGLRIDAEAAVSHRDALKRKLAELVDTGGAVGGVAARVQLREAERVAEANRTVYEASLNQLREVEQQQTRQEVEARIISPAAEISSPSFPRPAMFIAGGGAAGMLAGVGLMFLLPMFEHRVISVAAAEKSFALPVLTKVPYLRQKDLVVDGRKLSIVEYLSIKPLSRYAESLRSLRIGLRLIDQPTAQIVQFTSAVPGEGKSTAAASLAATAAATGVRTVLVDLDFYNPAISKMFGLGHREGVVDVLLGNSITGSVMQSYQRLPLRILGAGSSLRPRPDTVETRQFKLFVGELAKNFDLVVLDTPPVLAVSDALLVSGVADATVMVVGWRSTPQDSVDQAIGLLRAAGAPLAGIVLNKVEPRKLGKYDGYRYGYEGYGEA